MTTTAEQLMNQENLPEQRVRVRVLEGVVLTPEQLKESAEMYASFREENDEAVKIGLYGDDLERALTNPGTKIIQYQQSENDPIYAPLLVPAKGLEWYNLELLNRTYGKGTEFYYFAHPPIPEDDESRNIIKTAIQEKLDEGAIIFMDRYLNRNDPMKTLGVVSSSTHDQLYKSENLGDNELPRKAEVFASTLKFERVSEVKKAPSFFQIYQEGIRSGEFEYDPQNGADLVEKIEGEEAEEVWEIYEKPFLDLGEDDPIHAGFDKNSLFAILSDPGAVKLVNRENGKITTLCMFVPNFDQSPWFNKKYYENNYPDYYQTQNIFNFPGIVSDGRMRGKSYSMRLIDLATKVAAKRGTNVLVTFECTQTSAAYIPKIVTRAINSSGVGTVDNLERPISITEYRAIKTS